MTWQTYFKEKGAGDPYVVVAGAFGDLDPRRYGFDAAAGFSPSRSMELKKRSDRLKLLDVKFEGRVVHYDALARHMLESGTVEYRLFPGVCP